MSRVFNFFLLICVAFSVFNANLYACASGSGERSPLLEADFLAVKLKIEKAKPAIVFGRILPNQPSYSEIEVENSFSTGLTSDKIESVQTKIADIEPLLVKAMELIEGGANAAEIVVILDLDGTLTKEADPAAREGLFDYEVEEKGNAVATVKELKRLGVNVLISSAWDLFEETLYRVYKLGLLEEMEACSIPDCVELAYYKFNDVAQYDYGNNVEYEAEETVFKFMSAGGIISAKTNYSAEEFFRAKAVAPYAKKDLDLDSVKYVLFADDSNLNLVYFESHLRSSNVFGNLERAFIYFVE